MSKNSKNKKIISLRPSEIFGEYDNFDDKTSRSIPSLINKIIKNKNIIIDQNYYTKKNYIYVGALVEYIIQILELKNSSKNYDVFNLSDSYSYSLLDVLKIIKKNLNIKIKSKYINNSKKNKIIYKIL